jgi:aldehyde dehydrogenase (NAD+)
MTHAKSILISPADIDIDHLLPPYTPAKVQALSQWFEY